jgi:hypothetical protein
MLCCLLAHDVAGPPEADSLFHLHGAAYNRTSILITVSVVELARLSSVGDPCRLEPVIESVHSLSHIDYADNLGLKIL